MDILKHMDWLLAVILVTQLVVFAVMVALLRWLLLRGTLNAVERLKVSDAEVGRKEELIRRKMEESEQELLRKKVEAEEEIERRRAATEQDLARIKDMIQAEARLEADKIMSEAQLNKEKIREQLKREADKKSVEVAGELFKLVIGKTVTDKMNEAFVDELIDALEQVDETSVHIDASEASFVASHKLSPERRKRLETVLAKKFDVNIRVEEKIDPGLLAGLIIKLGSLEIDGSLLNRYREGVSEIHKTI